MSQKRETVLPQHDAGIAEQQRVMEYPTGQATQPVTGRARPADALCRDINDGLMESSTDDAGTGPSFAHRTARPPIASGDVVNLANYVGSSADHTHIDNPVSGSLSLDAPRELI